MNLNDVSIEFGVHSVAHDGERITVSGRCYRGPLRVGDRFRFAYETTNPESEDGYVSSSRGRPTAINLLIESIKAYGRSFEELDEAMTAEIVLSGRSGGSVREKWTLGG